MESVPPPGANGAAKSTIRVSLPDLAKMIDHSLLHPTMTDADVIAGLELSRRYSVATACVKPYHIPLAVQHLAGTSVLVCPVIGFPHGNSTTQVKVFEATEAAKAGGKEIDMVINVGKALSGEWRYVEEEIAAVNAAVVAHGAILKVIFENDCESPSPRAATPLVTSGARSPRERHHQALRDMQWGRGCLCQDLDGIWVRQAGKWRLQL